MAHALTEIQGLRRIVQNDLGTAAASAKGKDKQQHGGSGQQAGNTFRHESSHRFLPG